MKTSISLLAFILDQYEKCLSAGEFENKVFEYARFLSKPLTLGMFVPCDEEGNVLEEPDENDLNRSFFKMQVDYNKQLKFKP